MYSSQKQRKCTQSYAVKWKLVDTGSKLGNKYSGLLFLYNNCLRILWKIELTENCFLRSPISLWSFKN